NRNKRDCSEDAMRSPDRGPTGHGTGQGPRFVPAGSSAPILANVNAVVPRRELVGPWRCTRAYARVAEPDVVVRYDPGVRDGCRTRPPNAATPSAPTTVVHARPASTTPGTNPGAR